MGNAEELDIAMSLYNLLEYNESLPMTHEDCGIIKEMKFMILMIMLHSVNHLSIRQKW